MAANISTRLALNALSYEFIEGADLNHFLTQYLRLPLQVRRSILVTQQYSYYRKFVQMLSGNDRVKFDYKDLKLFLDHVENDLNAHDNTDNQ